MKQIQIIMGMPVTVEVIEETANSLKAVTEVLDYFRYVDQRFSTYKEDSEISRINHGKIREKDYSRDMKKVFRLSEEMKERTKGYFDIKTPKGSLDPSGLVKGWAIFNASKILDKAGIENYYVSAGDDIQLKGYNKDGQPWSVGIRHPGEPDKIVKVIYLTKGGVATSGTYIRGKHIYDPIHQKSADGLVSLTVIGPDIYQADVYATAAFAMGKLGISFLQSLPGFEGYAIDSHDIATFTDGFEGYLNP